jgi:hypothetical protein
VTSSAQKRIYLIDIPGATDISDPTNGGSGLIVARKTLEQMSVADLDANGIVFVSKTLIVDMLIGVSNDDDFGVTDDGKGKLIQKVLPSGKIDHNELWLFHLSKSLKSIH